jgi:hypothetical protein
MADYKNKGEHRMAIKSVVVDESGTHHLTLGLNRENVDSLLNGNVFTFPKGMLSSLSEDSDVVLLFAETDPAIRKALPTHPPTRLKLRDDQPTFSALRISVGLFYKAVDNGRGTTPLR